MSKTRKGFMFLDKDEVEKIWNQKEMRKGLAGLIAERKGIKLESARRWIKREENKGCSVEDILGKDFFRKTLHWNR
ncbi:MAG: hypothetical protein NTV99_11940 [Deltaproteobacteria bacterium]|nr:hypothetical protein [Deltaproteobacteria bacterium]